MSSKLYLTERLRTALCEVWRELKAVRLLSYWREVTLVRAGGVTVSTVGVGMVVS